MRRTGTPSDFWSLAAWAAVSAVWACNSTSAADLNGFLREKGRGDVAVSYTSESYDRFWVGSTQVDVPNGGDVKTRSLSVWLAYGLTDDLTLVGDLPYVDAESDGFDLEQSALQDLTVLGEYRFASVGSEARSDFIGAGGFRTHASNYDPNRPVDVGDGTSDVLFRFVYQLTVGGFYFSQQLGYDLRNEDAPDGIPLYTETGYTWGPVTGTAFLSVLRARGGSDIGDPGFTFPGNAEEYQRVGARVYVRASDRFGLSGAYFKTLDGRNTGDSSGFSGGINVSF